MNTKTQLKTRINPEELWREMAWNDNSDEFRYGEIICRRNGLIVRGLTGLDSKIMNIVNTLREDGISGFFTVPIAYHCRIDSDDVLTIYAVRVVTPFPDRVADALEKRGYVVMIGDFDFEYYVEVYLGE